MTKTPDTKPIIVNAGFEVAADGAAVRLTISLGQAEYDNIMALLHAGADQLSDDAKRAT